MEKKTLAALAVVAAASAAHGFNPEEHKLAGDLGSQKAGPAIEKLLPGRKLVRVRRGLADGKTRTGEDIRIVAADSIPRVKGKPDPRFRGFIPRDRRHVATSPILLWVGKADGSGEGAWFTFGDLVSLYGDFRRIITCDHRPSSDACLLADEQRLMTLARRTALRDLSQGWTYWDGQNTTKISTVAKTNDGTYAGRNDQAAWADEFFKIAKTNHWHFGDAALRWYASMHRQAFYLAAQAAKARAAKKPADEEKYLWKALHYEAHALHSLTDLFAPGHVMADRLATAEETLRANRQTASNLFPAWQQRIWLAGVPLGGPASPARVFAGVDRAAVNQLQTLTGVSGLTRRGFWEAQFHDSFNKFGTVARNLKQLHPRRFAAPHAELGGAFRLFGDGELAKYGSKGIENRGQLEWVASAVQDSITALFSAYGKLATLPADRIDAAARTLSAQPALYEAIGNIPIQMRNACYNPKQCFAPEGKAPAPFKYVYYARDAARLVGIDLGNIAAALLPKCTGLSATKGAGSNALNEACEYKYDGRTAITERDKAKGGK